jgi:hypothetical protein
MGERKFLGMTVGLSEKDKRGLKVAGVIFAGMIELVVLAHAFRRDVDARRNAAAPTSACEKLDEPPPQAILKPTLAGVIQW